MEAGKAKIGMIIVNLLSAQPPSSVERKGGREGSESQANAGGIKRIKINDCVSLPRSQQDAHSKRPLLHAKREKKRQRRQDVGVDLVSQAAILAARMIERGSVAAAAT